MKQLILSMALMVLFMIGIASALRTPTILPEDIWQENTKLIINYSDGVGVEEGIRGIAITLSSPSTANGTSTMVLFNKTNSSIQNYQVALSNLNETFGMNYTIEDAGLNDATTRYSVVVRVYFNTTQLNSAETLIIIDRTKPQVPTTAHSANTEFTDVSGSNIITYDVIGANVTSCRIAFLVGDSSPRFSGSNTFAMVHSGNTCKYTVTKSTIPDSTYKTYIRASDGTNTSISTVRDFKIKTLEGVAEDDISALSVPIVQKKILEQIDIGIIVLIVIFGVFGYMAFFKKK